MEAFTLKISIKRKLSVFCFSIVLAFVLCGFVRAQASGNCGAQGDNVTWEFDLASGVLTVSGKGAMDVYSVSHRSPWNKFRQSIEQVVFEGDITHVGDRCFAGCEKLSFVVIPPGVTTIGKEAFYNCDLTFVFIPESVTFIGRGAFTIPGKAATVINLAHPPFKSPSVYTCMFDGFLNHSTLYVSAEYVDEYRNTAFWNEFGNIDVAVNVKLDKDTLNLIGTQTAQLRAIIDKDITGIIKDLEWSSDNPDVATVAPDGTVTAKNTGDAVITVKTVNAGAFKTCSVRVATPEPPPAPLAPRKTSRRR
jgi:hypothetical protein